MISVHTARMLVSFAEVQLKLESITNTLSYIITGDSNCNDGEIRLNGGQSQAEGIVEICFGGVWGTICDDGWDDSDARVACRQLGYSHGYGR